MIATIQRDGATDRVSASWVVGCDGYHSATRKLSGIEMSGHDLTKPWAVFDATLAGWPESYEANYAYLDQVPVILTALPQQRWRVYLRPSTPESDLAADALTTIRRYLPTTGFDDVANPTRFQCHSKVAAQFRADRVLLAGDAAHVCTPAQGHGMNSGLQDAFNLAWKLALVCQGHCSPALLESYDAERRPVAEAITASGDAFERVQSVTEPAELRTRDKTLRGVFADPASRYHESIAEAELDVDYGNSPIVMGDKHVALAPGERLPDTITVCQASGRSLLLHEFCFRNSHTALIIGGPSTCSDRLTEIDHSVQSRIAASIVEASEVLTARSDDRDRHARIEPAASDQLGIGEVTLLVIRPDGHVGLRANSNHHDALETYQSLLVSNRT